MSGKQVCDASGNRTMTRFRFSNSQLTEELFGCARRVVRTFGCILFLSLFTLTVTGKMSAQTFGNISGHVADSTGAVIPGATVTLTNVGTAGKRTTVTTDSGDYTFTAVPVGVYNIQATHAGFKTAASNNVAVQIQQSLRLDFTLEVGAVTDSIEVLASARAFAG